MNYYEYKKANTKPAYPDCEGDGCAKIARQYADISTNIEIKPRTEIGEVQIECCGEPAVTCDNSSCGTTGCININQKICVKIPITYNVLACIGDSTICCDNPACGCGCDSEQCQ